MNTTLQEYKGTETILNVENHITTIGDFAFYNNDFIEEISLPEGLTTIGSFAFYGCRHLKKINIPSSVTLIGPGAFSWCQSLESIVLPDHLTALNKSTFFRCEKLCDIQLSNNIQSIEHSAFGYCKSLKHIDLPQNLQYMGDFIFEHCTQLESLILPDGLRRIGKKAFYQCINLRYLKLSQNIAEIDEAAIQTYGQIQIESPEMMLLTSRMFDEYYNFDVKSKNDGNYQFVNSYLPYVQLDGWKKIAKIILLVNFLETYDRHMAHFKTYYLDQCDKYKNELLDYLMKEKRYVPLYKGLDIELFSVQDIEPYFESVTDREEKAKLMEYKNKTTTSNDLFSDLEDELFSLFD